MRITDLNIPSEIMDCLVKQGYSQLYPPQLDAVKTGVLDGKNLVLASPTASGKTLIAELCAMNHIFKRDGKVLYLTPLRALANEKYEDFKKYTSIKKPNGRPIKAALTTGDYDSSDPWLERFDIIITTNEKADSLLRHKSKWMNAITLVVADEVHLINEHERGPTLEIVLAKLMTINQSIQLLALSATISNAEEIAEWLNAEVVTRDWRPVPLKEGVYYNGVIQFNDSSTKTVELSSSNASIDLAVDSIKGKGQALIFMDTRRSAVNMARKTAMALKLFFKGKLKPKESLAESFSAVGEKTRLSEMLAEQTRFASAFHHAGLGYDHRKLVEKAFREGNIKILAATPTLASGVNLPARTVIINSYERYEPGYGRYPISVLEYKQLCGRAGRPQYDTYGESLLIARNEDERERLFDKYIAAEPEKIWSKLASEKALRPHVLSVIASDFASSEEGIFDFFSKTFFNHQYGLDVLKLKLNDVLSFLYTNNLIEVDKHYYRATPLGRRVSELYIDPASAVVLRDRLLEGSSVITELSFLHLVAATPDLAPKLHPYKKEINDLELFADNHLKEFLGKIPNEIIDYLEYQEFLAEVKAARILLEWINEASEDYCLEHFRIEPGDLLRLVGSAEWLLFATSEISKLLTMKKYLALLEKLRVRVSKGIGEELLPLVKLEGIGRVRARMLYNAGYTSLYELRKVHVSKLLAMPLIGKTLAKKIKEQAGGTITAEEWALLQKKEKAPKDQSRISEYP